MSDTEIILAGAGALFGVAVVGGLLVKMLRALRIVVDTNEVHIVQNRKTTISYGKDSGNGNCYYAWPSWLPFYGVSVSRLPTNNFVLPLNDYEAYDKGRLPFLIDIRAFFRIQDSNTAAQRVSNFVDLQHQLLEILKGSLRSILASNDLEHIMEGRSTFGDMFTKEVSEQLSQWGVQTVRNVELMDIRDAKTSTVIQNIMAKKQSQIEMESRTEVAKNKKTAEIAEVNARREVNLQQLEAEQQVGTRKAESNREVALVTENATQQVKEQQKITKEKEMNVLAVERTRVADIAKTVSITNAEATLEQKRREAEAVAIEGTASAEAEKARQLAKHSRTSGAGREDRRERAVSEVLDRDTPDRSEPESRRSTG